MVTYHRLPILTTEVAMLAAPGVVGAPQAGAGFGGCLVALVEVARAADFGEYVSQAYARSTGIEPRVYTVQASEGRGRCQLDQTNSQPMQRTI